MLRELYINNQKFYNDVFDVGIYLYSQTLEGDEEKQYKDALKFLGITQKSIPTGISNAKNILSRLPGKYPIAGLPVDILFDYYKNEKDEFEIICLGTFLAIRSIIGKKTYSKLTKEHLNARTFGYSSVKEMTDKITPLQVKYKKRYHIDKVLKSLQAFWHLKMISKSDRGIYVSFDLTLEKLAEVIQKNNKDTRWDEIQKAKRDAIEKAKIKFDKE